MDARDAFEVVRPFRPAPRLVAVNTPRPAIVTSREPAFRPFAGQVYMGTARLAPEIVEGLLRLFEREAHATRDWTLYDELLAAKDGVTEPPMGAA